MSDALLTFKPSPSASVTEYDVTFTVNGTAEPVLKVVILTPDASGNLTAKLSAAAPGVTLSPGDVVGASVVAVDTVHALSSPTAVASPVTVAFTAPEAPVIVSLTIV